MKYDLRQLRRAADECVPETPLPDALRRRILSGQRPSKSAWRGEALTAFAVLAAMMVMLLGGRGMLTSRPQTPLQEGQTSFRPLTATEAQQTARPAESPRVASVLSRRRIQAQYDPEIGQFRYLYFEGDTPGEQALPGAYDETREYNAITETAIVGRMITVDGESRMMYALLGRGGLLTEFVYDGFVDYGYGRVGIFYQGARLIEGTDDEGNEFSYYGNGKAGVLDLATGEVLIEPTYDEIYCVSTPYGYDYLEAQTAQKNGVLLPSFFSVTHEGIFYLGKGNSWFDFKPLPNGCIAINESVDWPRAWRILNTRGEAAFAGLYGEVWGVYGERAVVQEQNGYWGIVDPTGAWVAAPRYRTIESVSEGETPEQTTLWVTTLEQMNGLSVTLDGEEVTTMWERCSADLRAWLGVVIELPDEQYSPWRWAIGYAWLVLAAMMCVSLLAGRQDRSCLRFRLSAPLFYAWWMLWMWMRMPYGLYTPGAFLRFVPIVGGAWGQIALTAGAFAAIGMSLNQFRRLRGVLRSALSGCALAILPLAVCCAIGKVGGMHTTLSLAGCVGSAAGAWLCRLPKKQRCIERSDAESDYGGALRWIAWGMALAALGIGLWYWAVV